MKIKTAALAMLIVIHIGLTIFTIVPGYLSIDEAIYHWQLRDLSDTGGFISWTGYREFPSVELIHNFFRIHDGRPVVQYPHIYAVAVLPFYLLFGFYGAYLFNATAFLGLLVIVYKLSLRLFQSREIALDSCLILILAGYVWEYSQAAWPHSASIFMMAASFYFSVAGLQSNEKRAAMLYAMVSGLIAGFATGFRLDAVLIIPCLFLLFLLSSPTRLREILALILGLTPGLLAMSAINKIKFGVFHPFTYGVSYSGYAQKPPWDIILLGIVAVVALWIISRRITLRYIESGRGKIAGAIVSIVLLSAMVSAYIALPGVKAPINEIAGRAYTSVVDIRNLSGKSAFPAMSRSPGGGVIYMNSHKKALLQSMPYLALILIPLIVSLRNPAKNYQTLILLSAPAVVFAFYWKNEYELGGLCLNYRFFLPAIPFLVILIAKALDTIRARSSHCSWLLWTAISLAAVFSFLFLNYELYTSIEKREFTLLTPPLLFSLSLVLLTGLSLLLRARGASGANSILWAAAIWAMAWSGSVALLYDYPIHRARRIDSYKSGEMIKKIIPPNSLFITYPFVDAGMRVLEKERVRIAFPANDKFRDFPELVEFYLNRGTPVFSMFPAQVWKKLMAGPLREYKVNISARFGPVIIGQIIDRVPGGPDSGSDGGGSE
jgi:hypothetical protein